MLPKISDSTILVVDDNKENISVIGGLLKDLKYRIAIATSGIKALELVEEHEVDLILLDIMMPEIDGYEVCRKLKENPKTRGIPVIFLTAKTDPDDLVKGFDLGAVDYVTKPFNKAELIARVNTHLKLRASMKIIQYQSEELRDANKKILGTLYQFGKFMGSENE